MPAFLTPALMLQLKTCIRCSLRLTPPAHLQQERPYQLCNMEAHNTCVVPTASLFTHKLHTRTLPHTYPLLTWARTHVLNNTHCPHTHLQAEHAQVAEHEPQDERIDDEAHCSAQHAQRKDAADVAEEQLQSHARGGLYVLGGLRGARKTTQRGAGQQYVLARSWEGLELAQGDGLMAFC